MMVTTLLALLTQTSSAADYHVAVTPWCDNSFRVQVSPVSLGASTRAAQHRLDDILRHQGLAELPSALVSDCVKEVAATRVPLVAGAPARNGNLEATLSSSGSITFAAVDTGKALFTATPSMAPSAVPSSVAYNAHGAALPCAASAWLLDGGASIVPSREPGAEDLRSGDPHGMSIALNSHPIEGDGHLLSGVRLSFRYVAGYAPPEGTTTAATTLTASLVDAKTSATVAVLWTSPPLANASYDHYTNYSSPVSVELSGLRIACPNSLRLALNFTNHERNAQVLLPSLSVHLSWSDEQQPMPFTPTDLSDGFLEANLSLAAGVATERIFGLGQGNWTAEGGCPTGEQRVVPLLRNGQSVNLQQRKFHVSIPFAYSTAGYGFLFNMPGYGHVDVGALGTGGMHWRADATLGLDFWVSAVPATVTEGVMVEGATEGAAAVPRAEPIYQQYADATGHAPPLREHAMIFWQSRNRYKSSAIAMRVADRYASLGLPLGVLVIDYKNQKEDGDFLPDPSCFPSVGELSAYVARTLANATTVFSFWPEVLKGAAEEATLAKAGA